LSALGSKERCWRVTVSLQADVHWRRLQSEEGSWIVKIIKGITVIVFMLAWGCSDIGSLDGSGNPPWVDQLILQFQNAPPGNPPQSIWRYQYKGEAVYYVPAQCCDQFSVLYDLKGKAICAPDGGFTGRGDGRCPDFFQERANEVLIWRDSRTR
jgi:hypothetical protein